MRGHLHSGETHVMSRTQPGEEREEHVPCRVDRAYYGGPEVRGTGVQVGEEGLAAEAGEVAWVPRKSLICC